MKIITCQVALSVLSLLLSLPVCAQQQVTSCENISNQAAIVVDYEDMLIEEINDLTLDSLKLMSQHAYAPHHHVYGLTRVKPMVQYQMHSVLARAPNGGVCMVPQVTIKARFTQMQIFLAKELKDDCQKRYIRAHEMEHVSTWKTHLKAGLHLMKVPLMAEFSSVQYYPSAQVANGNLQTWVVEKINPMLMRLLKQIEVIQKQIDSPVSYARVVADLQTCPAKMIQ